MFKPMGHEAVFSWPQRLKIRMKAIKDLYNDVIMIEKNRKHIPTKDLFFRDLYIFWTKIEKLQKTSKRKFFFRYHQIFATKIKFCLPKWVVKLPWIGKWAAV